MRQIGREIPPPSLGALFPDYIDVEDFFFATDRDRKKIPIIYRGRNLSEKGGKVPLLEWPIPFGDKRLISYTSGHVTEEKIKP